MQTEPLSDQSAQAVRRAIDRTIVSVMAGRGRVKTARTVSEAVRAILMQSDMERRAAYILHAGSVLLTPKPAPPSDDELDIEITE